MNRLKRLGDATAFEIALAKTPVMVAIVCCMFGAACSFFSQPFTALMTLIVIAPMVMAAQRVFSDNFNGRNRVFCGQFPFTVGERLCAKLTTFMLIFAFYSILLFGVLVIYDVLPENYSAASVTSILLEISPNHLVAGFAWYIARALSFGLFIAAIFLIIGAFENKDKRKKESKAKEILKRLLVFFLTYSVIVFRSEIIQLLCRKCEYMSEIIIVPINLCLAAILIRAAYKKTKQCITD